VLECAKKLMNCFIKCITDGNKKRVYNEYLTNPATQVRRNAREIPWLDLLRKMVIIWGISATPHDTKLMSPKLNDMLSLKLQRQSLKYVSTHFTHSFFSFTQ